MAGRQKNVTDIIMPGTPAAGQLFQTDAANKLTAVSTAGVLDGYVLARNTTTGLWEARSSGAIAATGLKFSVALTYFAAAEYFDIPMGRFGATVKAWAARLAASGSAAWTVSSAPSATGSFTDMVGAGVAPSVSSALGALDTDVTDWTDQTLAADEVMRVTCSSITAAQATLTIHFERT